MKQVKQITGRSSWSLRAPPGRLVFLLLLVVQVFPLRGFAAEPGNASALLQRADTLRTSDHGEFVALLQRVVARSGELSPVERQHLRYLEGWNSAYAGDYTTAVQQLKSLVGQTEDVTVGFRAGATVVNVLVLARKYEEAFVELSGLLKLLPQITDPEAREQGLGIAGYLYNQVGQYDLGKSYADQVVRENGTGRGICTGGQLQLEALYKSGRLQRADGPFEDGIEQCESIGELTYANAIRTYVVRLFLQQGKVDDAILMLRQHYQEVVGARYPRMIAEYEELLAQAYWSKGEFERARQFALGITQSSDKSQYTEPLASAYRVLYQLAKRKGDLAQALMYHEQYAMADKAFLDEVSIRQIAYEKVEHEAIANRLQIDALNRENQVLQLQRELGEKAVENSRLYIALLVLGLVFIAFWAYRTKRLQLHFMRRSQQDGLTGIANRPHFIDQAERILQACGRNQRDICVVLCDLDRFKGINDKFGHAAGDYVLQQTVKKCQSYLRSDDLFGRLGGEEFGILLPGCNAEQARQRSELLREAIAAIRIDGGTEAIVSASFGIATAHASGYELWQLMAHADNALYQAKRGGRNRVTVFDELLADATNEQVRSFG